MKKILIANRGEIAVRVIRTARQMGIKTVAVFSDADRNAPHVVFADEAVHIGESPASKSYLVIDKIIQAAKNTKADAIHPGYGFLSENAAFAKACKENGITFIGPPESAIKIMGNKLEAKEAVRAYNIPMVPGIDQSIEDVDRASVIATEIGYPVLIKAAAGGGGKGMRVVRSQEDIQQQMERAISEAKSAFGDGSVFIEKYVTSPRHIEIQVLADSHGNVIHLFERECSIQRRHQKVIEEAPSAIVTPELRAVMGKAATDVARACNYEGVGTVEFLVDSQRNFYFLEMNTRLQVEHPVTEMITGLDLVEQQIKVAKGEQLAFKQEDLTFSGHAIELRVYAEDPENDFLPSMGQLLKYKTPEGAGIRVDDGYREGMNIPIFYDPMLAKLVVHSSTRNGAIEKMKKAIEHYEIEGIKTTLSFGLFAFNHDAFVSGNFDTNFIDHFFSNKDEVISSSERMAAMIALRAYLDHKEFLTVPKNFDSNWLNRQE